MFDSIFQLYYVFYGSLDVVSIGSIMLPVVKWVIFINMFVNSTSIE